MSAMSHHAMHAQRFHLFQMQWFECLRLHPFSSLTWCAASSGSSHSHPPFSSWEFFSDPSSQDRLPTGNQISSSPIVLRLLWKWIFWLITGLLCVHFYMLWSIPMKVFLFFSFWQNECWINVLFSTAVRAICFACPLPVSFAELFIQYLFSAT